MARKPQRTTTTRLRLGVGALTLTLLVIVGLLAPAASAQGAPQTTRAAVAAVESVGMTVSDLDRSVEFYTSVLGFEKQSDIEVTGTPFEQLQGVFGLRMRVARLRLGEETLELNRGKPPVLPRHAWIHDRRGRRELWHRAGAPEQRGGRSLADHQPAG